jgi:hypothetical protein
MTDYDLKQETRSMFHINRVPGTELHPVSRCFFSLEKTKTRYKSYLIFFPSFLAHVTYKIEKNNKKLPVIGNRKSYHTYKENNST